MKRHGSKYLCNFLKEHGYDVSNLKHIGYKRGNIEESMSFGHLEVYSFLSVNVIFVVITEDIGDGQTVVSECSEYFDGLLYNQVKNGKVTVIFGKPYKQD